MNSEAGETVTKMYTNEHITTLESWGLSPLEDNMSIWLGIVFLEEKKNWGYLPTINFPWPGQHTATVKIPWHFEPASYIIQIYCEARELLRKKGTSNSKLGASLFFESLVIDRIWGATSLCCSDHYPKTMQSGSLWQDQRCERSVSMQILSLYLFLMNRIGTLIWKLLKGNGLGIFLPKASQMTDWHWERLQSDCHILFSSFVKLTT